MTHEDVWWKHAPQIAVTLFREQNPGSKSYINEDDLLALGEVLKRLSMCTSVSAIHEAMEKAINILYSVDTA